MDPDKEVAGFTFRKALKGNHGKGGLFMKDDSKRQAKGKLSRREFIKAGVAGLGVAAVGGLSHPVFGQGPAIIKGTKLSILQGTYFIAPA